MMKRYLYILSAICLLAGCKQAETYPEFERVELDAYITAEKAAFESYDRRKIMRMGRPIQFSATIKTVPEPKSASYIYRALSVAKMEPMPEVTHQIFIETAGGAIISAYVEKQAADEITSTLKAGQNAHFLAHHAYTYAQGPALLIIQAKKE